MVPARRNVDNIARVRHNFEWLGLGKERVPGSANGTATAREPQRHVAAACARASPYLLKFGWKWSTSASDAPKSYLVLGYTRADCCCSRNVACGQQGGGMWQHVAHGWHPDRTAHWDTLPAPARTCEIGYTHRRLVPFNWNSRLRASMSMCMPVTAPAGPIQNSVWK